MFSHWNDFADYKIQISPLAHYLPTALLLVYEPDTEQNTSAHRYRLYTNASITDGIDTEQKLS